MSDERAGLARDFPTPHREVVDALAEFRRATANKEPSNRELTQLSNAQRPWDPASCQAHLRYLIYEWLDHVVGWINEEHTWRVDCAVPACWEEHPHIVHELACVACLRWDAKFATSPGPLQDWHRYVLPLFLDRIAQRVGATGCPPGRHQPNPGSARNQLYRDLSCSRARRRQRVQDAEVDWQTQQSALTT